MLSIILLCHIVNILVNTNVDLVSINFCSSSITSKYSELGQILTNNTFKVSTNVAYFLVAWSAFISAVTKMHFVFAHFLVYDESNAIQIHNQHLDRIKRRNETSVFICIHVLSFSHVWMEITCTNAACWKTQRTLVPTKYWFSFYGFSTFCRLSKAGNYI